MKEFRLSSSRSPHRMQMAMNLFGRKVDEETDKVLGVLVASGSTFRTVFRHSPVFNRT
jgi:hypothetical protein